MTPVAAARGYYRLCILFTIVLCRSAAQPSDQVIQAWTGPSDLGYLRVELWTPTEKEPGVSRLVIKCASLPGVTVHSGLLIRLPDDIRSDPRVGQLFIVLPSDMTRTARYGSQVVAAISPESELRLYSIGPIELRDRPTLKPI